MPLARRPPTDTPWSRQNGRNQPCRQGLSRSFTGRRRRHRQIPLEGRAFFALILIVIVFSILSPNYFSISNFLTMANRVAIYGLLSIGMLLVILEWRHRPLRRLDAGARRVIAWPLMRGVTMQAIGVILYPRSGRWWCSPRSGAFVGVVNGVLIAYMKAGLRRHPRHALRRARRRTAADQRPDLQQPRRQGSRQYRLRLAGLQPDRRHPDRRAWCSPSSRSSAT